MLVAWGLVIRARLGGSEAIVPGNELRTRVEGGGDGSPQLARSLLPA